eukprot:494923-Hanusia_phi.AAC.6
MAPEAASALRLSFGGLSWKMEQTVASLQQPHPLSMLTLAIRHIGSFKLAFRLIFSMQTLHHADSDLWQRSSAAEQKREELFQLELEETTCCDRDSENGCNFQERDKERRLFATLTLSLTSCNSFLERTQPRIVSTLAGDQSLHAELDRNAASNDPVCWMARRRKWPLPMQTQQDLLLLSRRGGASADRTRVSCEVSSGDWWWANHIHQAACGCSLRLYYASQSIESWHGKAGRRAIGSLHMMEL